MRNLQLYSGYKDEDVQLLRKYAIHRAELKDDHFVDGFGHKTPYASVPFWSDFNVELLQLPIPEDGYHAEGLEYVALVDSVDRARGSYCIVEIGAGWGPWMSLGGVLARRRGLAPIDLVGVEAHPARFALLEHQLAFNRLHPSTPDLRCRLIEGAVGIEEGWLWFPESAVTDMGAAASTADVDRDYRGAAVRSAPVKAYPLEEALRGLATVDLLHIDIQGAEVELVSHNLDLIAERVSGLMIGTHSRVIEGQLFEMLFAAGWRLHREKPCWVNWESKSPSLAGKTVADGAQYWRRDLA